LRGGLVKCLRYYTAVKNGDGQPSRASHGRERSADGLRPRASVIACSRIFKSASPPGLQLARLVRGAPAPLLLAPQTSRCACLARQKCARVHGRAPKVCCLIFMLFMQPCIESGTLSLRNRASGTVKVFSRLWLRVRFSGAARGSRAAKNAHISPKDRASCAAHGLL
jgi:hypothetical protein